MNLGILIILQFFYLLKDIKYHIYVKVNKLRLFKFF